MLITMSDLTVQLNQAVSILNQCRNQIRMNKADNALAILDRADLHKWLFCNKEISAWSYTTIAVAYKSLQKWQTMHKNIQLVLDILNECKEQNIEIHLSLLELLTIYYINVKQYPKALNSAQTLLKLLMTKNIDKAALFNVYGLLGQILLRLNNVKTSELSFKKQLELAENHDQSLIIAYSSLTNFYKLTKNQQLYFKHLSKEMKHLKSHQVERSIKWLCLKDYADFLKNYGFYVKALIQYENALIFVQENRLFKEEAYICLQIAELNTRIDNDLEALIYYQHCLSILFNLPYPDLVLKCINGYLGIVERQKVDNLIIEFCNECIKFNLHYIAQSVLNNFIEQNPQVDERFIHFTILLNSNDKEKCIYSLKNLLNHSSDSLILNSILRLLIEIGDYEQSCKFYNKWRSMDCNFGYLETLMISSIDGSLNLIECLEMSLKLNVDSQLYFLDLFCLYEHISTELYLMLDLDSQFHWLIFNQNVMEIEAKMELIGDLKILDKLFATLLGCNIDFDINLIYSSYKYLSIDEFKLLTVLSALFYYDQPLESLYCLEKLRLLHLQNELSKCGHIKNGISSKVDFQQNSVDNFSYCFGFSNFKFAWLKNFNDRFELIYCHKNNSLAFNEKMVHQIVQKLNLVEFSQNEFYSKIYQISTLIKNGLSIGRQIEKRCVDYEIGVLLIGDSLQFNNNDGFIQLKIHNELKQIPQIEIASTIFVDSNEISPLFLLKNNFQSEILIIIGNGWKNSSLESLLFSLSKCIIVFGSVEEVNHEFIDQIKLLLEGRTINVDELKKYAKEVYLNAMEIKVQCSIVQTRLKLKKALKSNQSSSVFSEIAAFHRIENKELMKCQKSSIFKRILFNNEAGAIQQLNMEPERTILELLFADYFYGTNRHEKLNEKDNAKIEKLALMFEEDNQLRRSCRSFKYKNNANMCSDNLSQKSGSSENDEAKVLDVSLPINY